MNIVVNTQLLLKDKLEGLGWFTYETLKRMCIAHPEHNFYFIFDRPYDASFIFSDNVKPIILAPPSRHPILWYIRFEYLLPNLLKKLKADVYVSPDGWSTLRTQIPIVQVIHDLNFEHFPQDVPFAIRHYFRYFFPRFAHKAKVLATVSQFSKQDIVEKYRIEPHKIRVLYNGCNPIYKPLEASINEHTKSQYSFSCPYFMYVGAMHPRKNMVRLFKAFDLFKKNDTTQCKLLIVGTKKWGAQEINKAYQNMNYKSDVVFLGRLGVNDLNKVFSAALALVFVPYFEGFGIPIIEAFNCGTAVITSNCSSMPEVAADAALLVDPYNCEDIANAMSKLSQDKELRNNLIQKGHIRKLDFSWDKTAQAFWQCIEEAVNNT